MMSYAWRQDLAPSLSIDPVLHYYPLLACRQEPRAPVTVCQDADKQIIGAVLPCDPPGVAWVAAASTEAIRALLSEVPDDMPITLPLWADGAVLQACPRRKLSTEVIAVCTAESFRRQARRRGATFRQIETIPGETPPDAMTTPVRVVHLACYFGQSMAGHCTYRVDGRGGGSVDRLVLNAGWEGAELRQTLLGTAAAAVLEEAERVIFMASGENQPLLGVARSVGFRSCYWLKSASPQNSEIDLDIGATGTTG